MDISPEHLIQLSRDGGSVAAFVVLWFTLIKPVLERLADNQVKQIDATTKNTETLIRIEAKLDAREVADSRHHSIPASFDVQGMDGKPVRLIMDRTGTVGS